jgi:hypothetical protein
MGYILLIVISTFVRKFLMPFQVGQSGQYGNCYSAPTCDEFPRTDSQVVVEFMSTVVCI